MYRVELENVVSLLVNRTDPRGPKAVALVAADVLGEMPWTTYLDDHGQVSFAVPSSTPGLAYRVTATDCGCADHQYRRTVCKHQLAARLRLDYVRTEQEPAF